MTRRFSGYLGALAAAALVSGSCIEDPLSNLDGTPAALRVSHTALQINQGSSVTITATVVDGRSSPLAVPIAVTACDANVSVTAASPEPVPATQTREVVLGVLPAASCINVSGAGFTQQVPVIILPTSFGGAITATGNVQGGDTISIASTVTLKFDTALVSVTFGLSPSAVGTIISKTPDLLRVLVPFGASGTVTIAGINVTYVTGLRATLTATGQVVQVGNQWAAASSWQTAPDISSMLPAGPGNARMIVGSGAGNVAVCPEESFGSLGPCMMFKFTVAATTTLNFNVDWEGTATAPDVDVYVCADTVVANLANDCFVDGGSGATAAKPQTTGNDAYAAGTYWLVVEVFDGTLRNSFVTITRP
jgi:hypothetical protein